MTDPLNLKTLAISGTANILIPYTFSGPTTITYTVDPNAPSVKVQVANDTLNFYGATSGTLTRSEPKLTAPFQTGGDLATFDGTLELTADFAKSALNYSCSVSLLEFMQTCSGMVASWSVSCVTTALGGGSQP